MTASTPLKVFISRAGKSVVSVDLAHRLYKWLTDDGHEVIEQDHTFKAGDHIGMAMSEGMNFAEEDNGRIVALYCEEYMESDHCLVEALFPAYLNGLNRDRKLVPFLVDNFSNEDKKPAILKAFVYSDLCAPLSANNFDAVKSKVYKELGLPTEPPPKLPIGIHENSVNRIKLETRSLLSDIKEFHDEGLLSKKVYSKHVSGVLNNYIKKRLEGQVQND